ncbi:MAG TPA: hypothetical protein VKZ49_17795 [Polyangiaceae bacterium]|nr:hypothetical protein [Polyangiaceae bacterium]
MARSGIGAGRRIAALLLLLVSIFSDRAAASEAARVLIVHADPPDTTVLRRLSVELGALGFDVVRLVSDRQTTPGALDDLAREANAVAAVRLTASERGVEVWIADRVTGKTLLRDFVIAEGTAAEELVALRTVELLRASLLELQLPQARQHAEVTPPSAAAKLSQPRPESDAPGGSTVELGPAVLLSPGGVPPAFVAGIGARFDFGPGGIFANVLLPTVPGTLEGTQGQAAVSTAIAVLGADLELSDGVLKSRIGVGMGLVHLRMTGSAVAPFSARTDTITVPAPVLGSSLLYHVTGPFQIGVQLLGGATLSRPVITFADQQVAVWGRPFASAAWVFALQVD